LSISLSPQISTNYVNTFFVNLGSKLPENIISRFGSSPHTSSITKSGVSGSFVLLEIDTREVNSTIISLSSDSAAGCDEIPI
jgi:hypothetical protein